MAVRPLPGKHLSSTYTVRVDLYRTAGLHRDVPDTGINARSTPAPVRRRSDGMCGSNLGHTAGMERRPALLHERDELKCVCRVQIMAGAPLCQRMSERRLNRWCPKDRGSMLSSRRSM